MRHSLVAVFICTTALAAEPAKPEPVAATDFCYELSKDGTSWPRESQQLCIKTAEGGTTARFQLMVPGNARVLGSVSLTVTARARCIDCNKTTYTVDAPPGPLALTIVFDGKRPNGQPETGTVTLFGEKLSYRSVGSTVGGR